MKEIALVVPALHLGGGVPTVAEFVKEVAERSGNWRVRPVSLSMASGDPESILLRKPATWTRGVITGRRSWLGNDVPHVGAVIGEFEFQRYRPRQALKKAIAGCDLIQLVCGSPAWANAVVGLGVPVSLQVATLARVERRMRDGQGRGPMAVWRRFMTQTTNRLDERALQLVDAIQVENLWMLEHVQRTNRDRRDVEIRYAPPGVDTSVFAPLADRMPQSGYILCVGRLDDPRKNIGLLLESYALLPSELQRRHPLVLAGASGPKFEFWKRVEQLDLVRNVQFVERPRRDELVALFQQASVFALSSDEEGLGMVVIEAMACGVPVVCTRCGGPDAVVTDGVDGALVELNDEVGMARALTELLTNTQRNLAAGAAARKTVEQRYAFDVARQAFLGVWDRLVERRRA